MSLLQKQNKSETKSIRKKYCSRKCQVSYQKENPPAFWSVNSLKKIVNCSNCNKELLRKPSSISNNNFCNVKCKTDFQRANGYKLSEKLQKRFSKHCSICGKEYKVIKSRMATSKYCSRICLGRANGDRAKFEYRKRVIKNCANCNGELELKPSIIRKYNFCNIECMACFYSSSDLFKGENSGTWAGGDIDYYGPNWLEQRRKARKRDNYTCQDCGVLEKDYPKELSVHHIIPFRNFNGDWERANELSNLVTLCEYPCHRKRHSKNLG